MKRLRIFSATLAWVSLAACDARELPVFEFPGVSAGAGGAGSGGVGAEGGAAARSGSGGDAGGAPEAGVGADGGGGDGAAGAEGGRGGAGGVGGAAGSGGAGGRAGSAAGGTGGATQATPCTSPSDCMPNWLCEKPSCDAEVGECQPPAPLFCPPEPAPVCGCNGVTYWNDCVRQQTGVQVMADGECPVTAACACTTSDDCAVPGASCARLLQGGHTCGFNLPPGACWVLPARCAPNFGDPPIWQECRPPDVPEASCVDTCLAIRSERPHARKQFGYHCD